MTEMHHSFEDAMAGDVGMITDRNPQSRANSRLPDDLLLVSADNHMEITQDIFFENFPKNIRDRAPRVWFDKYWRMGQKDAMQAMPVGFDIDKIQSRSVRVDAFDFDVRKKHLDVEGITKEIVYPQTLLGFIRHPDQELQEAIYRTYNEYMAGLSANDPKRFYPVGIISNWWDYEAHERAIRQVIDLGLKSFMIPYSPGKDVNGNVINYASPEMDRFWAMIQESGLPVNFHIGEVPGSGGRGTFGTFVLTQMAPFRQVFGRLVFGGVFDRFPALQVVFAEGGINWVASALQDAEMVNNALSECYEWEIKYRPIHYWRNNMYATFQTDAIGLRLMDWLGADRVMWGQDYPHSEGTFGFTADAAAEIIAVCGEADARKILSENAMRVYKLDS